MQAKPLTKHERDVVMLGVHFTHLSIDSALATVMEATKRQTAERPLTVFTPNVEQLIQATHDPGFLRMLNAADVRVPDSGGLATADWWRAFTTGSAWRIRERVAGIDLAEAIGAEARTRGLKVAIIGGMDEIARRAAQGLKNRFEGLEAWGIDSAAEIEQETDDEFERIKERLNQIQADILFVGFGAPKQERWVLKHGENLPVKVVMVVGGAVDMWAGKWSRAPLGVRRVGLEWLWRLIQQPGRWKRHVRLLRFGWLTLTGKV